MILTNVTTDGPWAHSSTLGSWSEEDGSQLLAAQLL